MLVKNLLTGTTPCVLHRNGNPAEWRARWERLVGEFFEEAHAPCEPCADLTVITWRTQPARSIVERSLERWGVPCVTLGRALPEWRNDMKLYLNVEALERITSPYVMGLDADDVLVVAPAAEMLAAFRTFDCDLVFSAEKASWPPVPFLTQFEAGIAESAYAHLNSGAWIGTADACRRFFRDCLQEDDGDIVGAHPTRGAFRDDQGRTRKTFRRWHPAARLDYHCRLFQSLWAVPLDGEVLISPRDRAAAAGAGLAP